MSLRVVQTSNIVAPDLSVRGGTCLMQRGKLPVGEGLPDREISDEVKRFIHDAINSVDQLEVLLLLVSNPDKAWTAQEVSERIRLAPESASSKLADLQAAQLLTATPGPPIAYRYAPSSSALAQEVADSLNEAYREGRDSVIQLIYSRPLDNIRYFADAFKIKKKE